MPHNKQAAKRVRTNEKARIRNKDQRSAMKSEVKKLMKAVADGNRDEATKELAVVQQKIDKAAKNRVIHPNSAARRKSILANKVAGMK